MQTQVNIKQAIGLMGTWVNDALKSAVSYVLKGSTSTAAVAASGTITLTEVPTADDTITINGQEYTFTATPDQATFLVTIGADVTTTAATLASAISATNPFVSATSALGVVTLTARVGGIAGNDITVESSNSDQTVVDMSGGVDAVLANDATIGNAFTLDADGSSAKMGGNGAFLGILVNPHNIALYNGLTPSIQVPDGTVGTLAKSGYIFVKLATSSNVGDGIYFVQATGALGAGTAGEGQTQIEGAQVVEGGSAGAVVKIGFIPQK